jgi:predicted phosphate transport protein (TIGR00153 family)
LSDLVKWFVKRRETKALETIQRHLALTTSIVEDVGNAMEAAVRNDQKELQRCTQRVSSNEKEADRLRRQVMDEISKGELAPVDRVDLMDLVKRVDMVADWSRESTRVLNAIPMEYVPDSIKTEFVDMVNSVKECTASLRKCVDKIMTAPEEALQAADAVEREEEKVDDLHEQARRLLGKEDLPRAGVAVLISQLFEALEMIADACEDACDQIRIIMVKK